MEKYRKIKEKKQNLKHEKLLKLSPDKDLAFFNAPFSLRGLLTKTVVCILNIKPPSLGYPRGARPGDDLCASAGMRPHPGGLLGPIKVNGEDDGFEDDLHQHIVRKFDRKPAKKTI